jgi:hypothetical protein
MAAELALLAITRTARISASHNHSNLAVRLLQLPMLDDRLSIRTNPEIHGNLEITNTKCDNKITPVLSVVLLENMQNRTINH